MKHGFTLLEMLIYMCLFTLIMGGGVITAFYVIDSAEKTNRALTAEIEAQFLIQKIHWMLADVSAVHAPVLGGSSTILSVDKYNFSDNPLTLDLVDGRIRMSDVKLIAADNLLITYSSVLQVHFSLNGKDFVVSSHVRN